MPSVTVHQTGAQQKPEKILVALFRLSNGTTEFQKYEDIVVQVFEMFPADFALRGYPQHPDSSDVHKPLYGTLKRRGLVRVADKNFALTPLGVETATKLNHGAPESINDAGRDRMPRDLRAEADRMLGSAAFEFYAAGQKQRILDTDFYRFLGCTVRTPRNDFLGRVSTADAVVQKALQSNYPDRARARMLTEVWNHLLTRFRPEIEQRRISKR